MRAIPQHHPVGEAHSCLIQSPSRAITTEIGEITRTYESVKKSGVVPTTQDIMQIGSVGHQERQLLSQTRGPGGSTRDLLMLSQRTRPAGVSGKSLLAEQKLRGFERRLIADV